MYKIPFAVGLTTSCLSHTKFESWGDCQFNGTEFPYVVQSAGFPVSGG